MQMRCTVEPVGKIQQLPDRNPRFPRIILPFRNRCCDMVIEADQPIANGTKSSNPPETFCSAENRPASFALATVCVMLKDGIAVLDYEQGHAALLSEYLAARLQSAVRISAKAGEDATNASARIDAAFFILLAWQSRGISPE